MIALNSVNEEASRIDFIRKLNILDSEPEKIYDDMVELAAQICEVPIALISIVDSQRQWFKARKGINVCETSRDVAFCAYTILSDEVLVVNDARLDPRFAHNPLVTGPANIRFYTGVPLVMKNGLRLGTICCIDNKERQLTKPQINALQILARQVVAHFQERLSEIERIQLVEIVEKQRLNVAASAKMAALGEMAAGIAHEINNPLTAIMLWSNEIQKMGSKNAVDIERLTTIGGSIQRVGMRISKSIHALRAFAMDESNFPMEISKIKTIIEETLELCHQRFKNGGVTLSVSTIDDTIEVPCRAVEISQVLLNLLNNAFDSIVEMEERWIEVSYQKTGDLLEISVRDSGPALPADFSEKIMAPFFTTKPVGKGTGLGLSISTRIAQTHGGNLIVDPKDDHARFILSLPCKESSSLPTKVLASMK